MFDADSSFFPKLPNGPELRAYVVGFCAADLEEMTSLLDTLGVNAVANKEIKLRKPHAGTYIGKGKIEEIRNEINILEGIPLKESEREKKRGEKEKNVLHAVVFDAELSPVQLRNLEKELKIPTLDRSGVILEIFSEHARTSEAKAQVEMAKLQYLLPRLAHFWTHFERQRGGIGLMGGMGEKQLEVDRRILQSRMKLLQKRLMEIEKTREVQRASRKDVLKVALVGYTNAGKSTLLNVMTDSSVRAENKLFATLDPSVRTLDPNSHPPVVAIDTVGFISRIPPSLIASFRSTLEEIFQADLILHVVDASSTHAIEQFKITNETLEDLELGDKPRIVALNKTDLLKGPAALNTARLISPGGTLVSAFDEKSVKKLRDDILEHFKKSLELWEVMVPYAESRLESQIRKHGSVEVMRHMDQGTFLKIRISSGHAKKLKLEKFRL